MANRSRFSDVTIRSQLATALLALLLSINFAVAGALERGRFSVVVKGVKYNCSSVTLPAIPIFRHAGRYVTAAQKMAVLKADLRRKKILNTRLGQREIRELNSLIARSKRICAAAMPAPTPTPIPSATPIPEVPASLAKISRPLTRADVQYFLDKSAFGLSPMEEPLVTVAINEGVDALVGAFMLEQEEDQILEDRVKDQLDGQIGTTTTQTPVGQRQAILDLMIHTRNPYHERLALFLLSVWTTAGDVISDETFRGAWWDYYNLLRSYTKSSDSLPDLAVTLTRDPLMLVYLNNELNLNISPNENYARELLELFTLGTTDSDGIPNYTETLPDGSGDIPTAARMLTGWKVTRNCSLNKLVASYQPNRHSNGPHTMFAGKPYQFSGETDEDLIRGIFRNHPSASKYYAREILKYYLSATPPQNLVEDFAQVLKDREFKLRDALVVLFSSEAFFDRRFKDTCSMNSLEFAVKSARLLNLFNAINIAEAEYQLRNMGMQINLAPSVFWYSPNAWTSSSIALERANYLALIMGDDTALAAPEPDWGIATLLPSGPATPATVIDHIAAVLGVTNLTSTQRSNVVSYFNQRLQYSGTFTTVPYSNTNTNHQNLKGLGGYYLLMLTPEFQLN